MGFLKNLVTDFVNYATEEAERKRQAEKKATYMATQKKPIPPPISAPILYDKNNRVIRPDLRVDSFDS